MKLNGIIVSGYFNPLHKGHVEYFHNSKKHGDELFIIVNNDLQRAAKGSKEFMLEDERLTIIKELKVADKVILSIDKDKTVIKTLKKIFDEFSENYNLFFANGGDQTNNSIPEAEICNNLGIKMIDGLGEKIQSSSWLIN